jgi:hypothetical protein
MTIKNSVQMYPGKLFIEAFRGTFCCATPGATPGTVLPVAVATGRTVPGVAHPVSHIITSEKRRVGIE